MNIYLAAANANRIATLLDLDLKKLSGNVSGA